MDQTSLVGSPIPAGAKFLQDLNRTLSVGVAFWVKEDDEFARPELYIGSVDVVHGNVGKGYRQVLEALSGDDAASIDPFQVKLLPIDDPTARAAIALRDADPRARYRHRGSCSLGRVFAKELYIYPAHA